MTNKMTNKEKYMGLLAIVKAADIPETDVQMYTDFINLKIEQLDKKANTVSKADKAKEELNATLAVTILEGMQTLDKPVKVSDLIKGYEPLSAYSTQKLTPIMTKLIADGKIVKSVVKREAFYSLV